MDHFTAFNVYGAGITHFVENTKQNVSEYESQPRPFRIQHLLSKTKYKINPHLLQLNRNLIIILYLFGHCYTYSLYLVLYNLRYFYNGVLSTNGSSNSSIKKVNILVMFIFRSIKYALNNNPLTYEDRKVLPIICLKLLIICRENTNIF